MRRESPAAAVATAGRRGEQELVRGGRRRWWGEDGGGRRRRRRRLKEGNDDAAMKEFDLRKWHVGSGLMLDLASLNQNVEGLFSMLHANKGLFESRLNIYSLNILIF